MKGSSNSMVKRFQDLWEGVEWDWYTKGGRRGACTGTGRPDYQWEMDFPVGGYNEALIMYILAASFTNTSLFQYRGI